MFDNLLRAVVGVATLPVDIVADIVTLGGEMGDGKPTHTEAKAQSILRNIEKATR